MLSLASFWCAPEEPRYAQLNPPPRNRQAQFFPPLLAVLAARRVRETHRLEVQFRRQTRFAQSTRRTPATARLFFLTGTGTLAAYLQGGL